MTLAPSLGSDANTEFLLIHLAQETPPVEGWFSSAGATALLAWSRTQTGKTPSPTAMAQALDGLLGHPRRCWRKLLLDLNNAQSAERATARRLRQEASALARAAPPALKEPLLNAPAVAQRLGISLGKVRRLTAQGDLPVHSWKTFRKWGRSLQAPQYLRALVDQKAPGLVGAHWVAPVEPKPLLPEKSGPRQAPRPSPTARRHQRLWFQALNTACVSLGYALPRDYRDRLFVPWSAEVNGWVAHGRCWIESCDLATPDATKPSGFPARATRAIRTVSSQIGKQAQARLETFVSTLAAETYGDPLLLAKLQKKLVSIPWPDEPARQMGSPNAALLKVWQEAVQHCWMAVLESQPPGTLLPTVEAGDYPALFQRARARKRRWTLHLGPTNSGKTHAALDALAAASSGVYLAPLRLLALEVFDAMNARGVPCSLHTGEETLRTPGARHISATIEAGWNEDSVEVAVVDEAQMATDEQRGWAWTQALVGVDAQHVLALGAPSIQADLEGLAHALGESVTVRHFERKTPLVYQAPIDLKQITSGDAVIAFSRQDVLTYQELLRSQGHAVACLYGNLGPEVRRHQAELFRSGQATVLVATDAIGLGLNLPIRRIVFSRMDKYDGQQERDLTLAEIRQIAGRAGRYGQQELGTATTLVPSIRSKHRQLLRQALDPMHQPLARSLESQGWPIQAPWVCVEELSRKAGPRSTLSDLLRLFCSLARKADGWRAQYDDEALEWARTMARCGLPLEAQFRALGCPTSAQIQPTVEDWLRAQASGQPAHLPPRWNVAVVASLVEGSLEELEKASKGLAAYAWLAQRFPGAYPDDPAPTRVLLHERIVKRLTQKGLAQRCKSCAKPLAPGHRFRECEACYRRRQRHRAEDDYGYR